MVKKMVYRIPAVGRFVGNAVGGDWVPFAANAKDKQIIKYTLAFKFLNWFIY